MLSTSCYRVHTNGPSSHNSYEYSFGTDENGQPTDVRSDLVITDTTTGRRHCLDVTFTDPSALVNMAGANPSTLAGLERLYKAHVQRYAHIYAYHNIQFHPLAFDTLGRAHKSIVGDIAHLFTKRDKRVGSLLTASTVHRRHAFSARAA